MLPPVLVERVREAVRADEALAIVQKLVQTSSHWADEHRERPIANLLRELFEREDVPVALIDIVDGRPNVLASLPGTGGGKSLLFNGHIDTVPPFGMEDPFGGEIRDGRLYGRGSSDMKAGVGTMAYAMIVLKRLGIRLRGDLYYAGVIDEDAAGSAGTKHIIEHGPRTDYAIVGEPTSLHPVIAHKGHDYWQVTFHGRSVHSSTPQNGVNANYAGADFIHELERTLVPRYRAMKHPLLTPPPVNPALVMGYAQANLPFLMGESRTYAGIIPDVCKVYMDVRWTPRQSLETVENDLREIAETVQKRRPDIRYTIEYIDLPHPAMEIEEGNPLVRTVQENMELLTGRKVRATGENYWGDTGLLKGWANIPCLMFGPGDIGCAHSDVEWVNIDELKPATELYVLTALSMCGYED